MHQSIPKNIFLERLSLHLGNHSSLKLDESTKAMMAVHFELLSKWNKAHNLISVDNLEQLILEHYLDSALALDLVTGILPSKAPIYDLGSGNGFPGLIGAMMWPDREFILVESLRKKCSFLRAARIELALKHVQVEQKRVQELDGIQVAVTRAAFSDHTIDDLAESFVLNGFLALMRTPSAEFLTNIEKGPWGVVDQINYTLDTGAERCVVVLKKKTSST